VTTLDLTNLEVTNIKAKDGTASATIADSTGIFTHSTATVFTAGTVSLPAITTSGDTNTGIYFPAADTIAFTEGGVESMRITSAGDVAIKTTAPILNGVLTVAQTGSTGAGSTTLTLDHFASNNKFIQFGWYGTNIGSISQASGTFINIDSPLLGFSTGGTERMSIDSSGNLGFNSGYGSVATAYGCRAWVNFNGTGTPAIRASGNVSSITDNGTGDYTVNFSNSLPDVNYVVAGTAMFDTTTSNHYLRCGNSSGGSGQMATGSCRVNTQLNASTTSQDCAYVMVSFHR
jgi:hypothetical protein